jgi:pimeloyl-ACP methyl ester carboxylesterase
MTPARSSVATSTSSWPRGAVTNQPSNGLRSRAPRPRSSNRSSSPGWAQRQALAHTLSQDLRLANNGRAPIERLKAIEIPVLALAGGASPPWAASTTAMLAGSLPHASERIVDGQQHIPADPVIAAILENFFR